MLSKLINVFLLLDYWKYLFIFNIDIVRSFHVLPHQYLALVFMSNYNICCPLQLQLPQLSNVIFHSTKSHPSPFAPATTSSLTHSLPWVMYCVICFRFKGLGLFCFFLFLCLRGFFCFFSFFPRRYTFFFLCVSSNVTMIIR